MEEAPQDLVESVDTRLEEAMQEELSAFLNALKVVHVDRADDRRKGREEHAKIYVPTLVKTEPSPGGKASIRMALPDSSNLLAHAAIDAKFHKQLGIPIEATRIKAQVANKQSLEIQGVSK